MQLLVKRGQSEGSLGRVTFDLWAKFEVTEEEQALLTKYNARSAILSEGNPWRDLRRGLLLGGAAGFVAYLLLTLSAAAGPKSPFLIGLLVFGAVSYVSYQQIREEIRVSDILDGRTFACRSVVMLIEKEQTVTQMVYRTRFSGQ